MSLINEMIYTQCKKEYKNIMQNIVKYVCIVICTVLYYLSVLY